MNSDLEEQLAEMGPEFRAVAGRLLSARRATDERSSRAWRGGWLAAASLVAAAGLWIVAERGTDGRRAGQIPPAVARSSEYALAQCGDATAVREMIRTQNADGSWQNDFLTRQNAAALRRCDTREAQTAYKKAMRNLRFRGIL